jgi:transcriptional regulator with XRE-family HTH domain
MSAELLKIRTLIASRRNSLPHPEVARALRRAAGLTVYELADALDVTAPTISRWERGLRHPRGQLRERYAGALEELRRV